MKRMLEMDEKMKEMMKSFTCGSGDGVAHVIADVDAPSATVDDAAVGMEVDEMGLAKRGRCHLDLQTQ